MKYPLSLRLAAVTWYRDNGKNYTQTAKKYKITVKTVKAWVKAHPEVSEQEPQHNKALAQIESSRSTLVRTFEAKQIEQAQDVVTKAYERIVELIPKEESIYNLVNLIEKLDPRNLKQVDPEELKGKTTGLDAILGKMREQWTTEQKNNIIDIDSEEIKES